MQIPRKLLQGEVVGPSSLRPGGGLGLSEGPLALLCTPPSPRLHPPGYCGKLLKGGRSQEENPGNSVVRDKPGLGRPRHKLPSALKVSWGKHNGMLSFCWRINVSEWK